MELQPEVMGSVGVTRQNLIGIHPSRKVNALARNAQHAKRFCEFPSGVVRCLLLTEGDKDPLHAMALKGAQVLLGHPIHAMGCGHVAMTRAPEGQSIHQGLHQDDVLGTREGFEVPDTLERTRKVELQRRALAQVVQELAPIHLDHVPGFIHHRDDQASIQMLVPAVPIDAEVREAPANLRPGFPLPVRQAQTQGPVAR